MRNPLTLWLTGIIVLTIVGFLAVFKPITFQPRRDPSDASRYLKPVGAEHFNAQVQPSATFPLFSKTSVYVYKPQHDLRLGLDLRGGMRVVLTIPDVTTFKYQLEKSLPDDDAVSASKQKLSEELAKSGFLGAATVEEQQVSVDVTTESVTVVTEPADTAEATTQLATINKAMAAVFGADEYTAPKASELFSAEKLKTQREANQESVRTIMANRLNSSGLTEVTAYSEGESRVVLEIPGVKDPDDVRRILRTTAQLEFYLIPKAINLSVDGNNVSAMNGMTAIQGTDAEVTKKVLDQSQKVMTGADMADFEFDTKGSQPVIAFKVRPDKQEYFGDLTAGHLEWQLAIVLDHKFLMAPSIKAAISSDGIIEGGFDDKEAQELVRLLDAGSLPVPVKIAETRTVSATLGADSISRSMLAGLIGLAAVLIFMAAYYRLPGLMANLALVIYIMLSLAVLKVFDATLTLPGIAGIIISIGMAVDANVIIFERLKEELRAQKPLETAIDVAFSRAWTAIIDSNVASLITGSVLYALGTGAVKGFAITLLIGVLVSLFTAVTVTRLLMKLMIRSKAGHKLAWYGV